MSFSALQEHALKQVERYFHEKIAMDGEEIEFELVEEDEDNSERSYRFVFEPAGAPRHHVQLVVEFSAENRHVEVWHYTLSGEASYRISDDDLPKAESAVTVTRNPAPPTVRYSTDITYGDVTALNTLNTIRNNLRGHYHRI